MHRILIIAVLLSACGSGTPPPADTAPVAPVALPTPATDSTFALIELFTSQGCSSCPPADRLLAELLRESEAVGQPVYGLSFHVDYWNRLGWTDPYSQAEYSRRQREYAGKLNTGVYTPQMIVNGRKVFVGSRRGEAQLALSEALAQPAATRITLETTPAGKDRLRVSYRLTGRTDGLVLRLALTDRKLENDVPRGENTGRHLSHPNVVRWLGIIAPAVAEGSTEVDLTPLADRANAQLIVYAQDAETWAVVGARAVGVRSEE